MSSLILDTEIDDYDSFDEDEDIELYDEELDEDYDEIEAENYSPEYLAEYEPDLFDDSVELAEALREAMHENYQHAPPEEMEEALFNILDQMTPAEGLNFTSALRQVGQTGLPIAGATIGTIYGGPMGAAVGGQLGQAAGQAFLGGKKAQGMPTVPSKTTQASPQGAAVGTAAGSNLGQAAAQAFSAEKKQQGMATVPSTTTQASPQGGSTAAAQLLQLTQNPVVLTSLLALALGSHGRKSIPLGKEGQSVRPGELMALFGKLASEAASDADQLLWESDETPAYLLDSEGGFVVDPAVPEERAEALYEALLTAENQALIGEELPRHPWSDYLPFAKGTKLLVEYETVIRDLDIGNGSILERTSDLFKAKIHIDKWDRFDIPETYLMLMIEYKQDGPGNKAVVIVNGQQYTDNNVTIRSGTKTREILMSINLLGQKIDRISINKESSNKAKLRFNAGGEQHVLVLTKD